jgi:hypothetical protein
MHVLEYGVVDETSAVTEPEKPALQVQPLATDATVEIDSPLKTT